MVHFTLGGQCVCNGLLTVWMTSYYCAYQTWGLERNRDIFLLKIFFFFNIFLMWTVFKIFIEFVPILLLFCVLFFFGCEACGILASDQGI